MSVHLLSSTPKAILFDIFIIFQVFIPILLRNLFVTLYTELWADIFFLYFQCKLGLLDRNVFVINLLNKYVKLSFCS